MYGGIDYTGRMVAGYADARAEFERIKPWRARPNDPKPLHHKRRESPASISQADDGSIVYRLYRTDVVVWHPDNTVTLTGYPSLSTSQFIWRKGPSWTWYQYGRGVLHHTPGDTQHVLNLDSSGPVTLKPHIEHGWEPVDYTALVPFKVPSIDRKIASGLRKEYHIGDLEAWFGMADALRGDSDGDMRSAVDWQDDDIDAAMAALREGEFVKAAQHMPLVSADQLVFGRSQGWHTSINEILAKGSVRKLVDRIYREHGALKYETKPTVTRAELNRIESYARRYE